MDNLDEYFKNSNFNQFNIEEVRSQIRNKKSISFLIKIVLTILAFISIYVFNTQIIEYFLLMVMGVFIIAFIKHAIIMRDQKFYERAELYYVAKISEDITSIEELVSIIPKKMLPKKYRDNAIAQIELDLLKLNSLGYIESLIQK